MEVLRKGGQGRSDLSAHQEFSRADKGAALLVLWVVGTRGCVL